MSSSLNRSYKHRDCSRYLFADVFHCYSWRSCLGFGVQRCMTNPSLHSIRRPRRRRPTATALHLLPVQALTKRQIDVLKLMSCGYSNREIASRLELTEETVKAHVKHVLVKLVARSRTHAVARAIRSGLIR